MVSFDIQGMQFQVRAAAVVVRGDRVLLHRTEKDPFWALPGGRVEPGETGASAIIREMKEEINEEVECDELLYLVENFFEYGECQFHEIGLYFHVHLQRRSPLLGSAGPYFGIEGHTKLIFSWFKRSELYAIELHPSFLRASLAEPSLSFKHIVQRG